MILEIILAVAFGAGIGLFVGWSYHRMGTLQGELRFAYDRIEELVAEKTKAITLVEEQKRLIKAILEKPISATALFKEEQVVKLAQMIQAYIDAGRMKVN